MWPSEKTLTHFKTGRVALKSDLFNLQFNNTLLHMFGKIILNYSNDLSHSLKNGLHILLYILDYRVWVVYLEILKVKSSY